MESYHEVREALSTFIGNAIHNLALARSPNKDAPTVYVDGTSYEEIGADKTFRVELKEYQTEVVVHNDEVKRLDFSLLRDKIYQVAKSQAREMNKDFLNNLRSEGLVYDVKEDESAVDSLLNLMRIYKKKGFNLDTMRIFPTKEMRKKFDKEMQNPMNQEKYYREWSKIKNE